MPSNRPYPSGNKKFKVVYSNTTCETARNLARALGIGYTQNPVGNHVIAVRWGSTINPVGVPDICPQSASAVKNACHGLHSLFILEQEGVPCVKPFTALPHESDFPVVGRCAYFHHGATDLVYLRSMVDAVVNTNVKYYTKYRPNDLELRVHVWGGEVIKMFKKVDTGEVTNELFRSSGNGWAFKRVRADSYLDAQAVAIKAVKALGLAFGGVDVARDSVTGEWFVFEVNTGPSLNSETLMLYAAKFREILTRYGHNYEPVINNPLSDEDEDDEEDDGE